MHTIPTTNYVHSEVWFLTMKLNKKFPIYPCTSKHTGHVYIKITCLQCDSFPPLFSLLPNHKTRHWFNVASKKFENKHLYICMFLNELFSQVSDCTWIFIKTFVCLTTLCEIVIIEVKSVSVNLRHKNISKWWYLQWYRYEDNFHINVLCFLGLCW